MIGSIHEIAYQNGWIKKNKLKNIIKKLGKNEYSKYLNNIL